MPCLRSLRIRGTTALGNRASDLLLAIWAPNLMSLTLFDMVHTDLDPWLSGFQLLQSLTSLTLYWPNFTTVTYAKLFRMMPSVTRLALMDRQPEDFLLFLGRPISGLLDFPWPELVDFALYPDNPNRGDIADMINGRAGHAPLHRLRVGSGAHFSAVQVLPFDSPSPWPAWPEQL
jgi:hypothetical protein